MLKKAVVVVAGLVGVLLAVIATRSDTFRVERSAFIVAPPAVVYSMVNDFHHWSAWSPWEKLDPAMKKTYEGAPAGQGAGYYWVGNDKVGEGRMTITDSQPSDHVTIKLVFMKPWEATNTTTFSFVPKGEGTQVTWTMTGSNNFVAKAFSIFMNMDSMIGKDFEKGLEQMKEAAVAEAQRQAAAEAAAEAAARAAAEAAARAAAAEGPAPAAAPVAAPTAR